MTATTRTAEACPVCAAPALRDREHPEASLFRCPSCRHRFSRLKAAPEAYGPDYFLTTHRNWFAHPNDALFGWVEARLPKDLAHGTLIDVGCGRGAFLEYLLGKKPHLALTGVDLSSPSRSPGIEFIQSDIMVDLPDRTFDVVTSFAVIEHVADPADFLARLGALCRPGGLIAIMTLNDQSLLYGAARLLDRLGFGLAFKRLYSSHHLHHFSDTSLSRLVERQGLKIIAQHQHNAPLAALDIPAAGHFGRAILLAGVAGLFALGRLVGRSYLQTIVAQKPL